MSAATRIPTTVLRIIYDFMLEFHRADAVERFRMGQQLREPMARICDDIRHNPPTYQLDMLTQGHAHMRLRIYLYDCDPHRIQRTMRIPASQLIGIRRCSLACRTHWDTTMIEIISVREGDT